MRSVGEAGEIEPETESFLVENEVEFGEFPAEALACLPTQRPWTLPQVHPNTDLVVSWARRNVSSPDDLARETTADHLYVSSSNKYW